LGEPAASTSISRGTTISAQAGLQSAGGQGTGTAKKAI
jgi:hypothetical protein